MRTGSAVSIGDRLLAVAFVCMALLVLVGVSSGQTTASFLGTSTNPSNTTVTMTVQPPAGQNATCSSIPATKPASPFTSWPWWRT